MDKTNLGVDIDREWLADGTGDIALVRYEDNVAQAIYNRLSCTLGNLDWVYYNYGSRVHEWLGKPNTPPNRQTLEEECENRIRRDPRLKDAKVEIIYYTASAVGMKVTGYLNGTHDDFEEYFLFGTNDVYLNKTLVHNDAYKNTWISTRRKGYAGRPGKRTTIHAHVCLEKTREPVPIGEVEFKVGSYRATVKEIQQSYGFEPGTATFGFTVPKWFSYGMYDLILTYKGAPGYNPCTTTVKFLVLPRLPTTTYLVNRNGSDYTLSDNELYVDTYEVGAYGEEKYWEKSSAQLAKDGYPRQYGYVRVDDYNGIPVGWEANDGTDNGTVTLSIEKRLSDRIPTTLKMYQDDNSFTYDQPWLIENCLVYDKYNRLVNGGNVRMWINHGGNIQKATKDIQNLKFTTGTVEVDKVYRLEDIDGNLVDTVRSVKNGKTIELYSTQEEGNDSITIN